MSGCRESNSVFILPKDVYYRYTTARKKPIKTVGMEGFEPSQDCSYTLLKRTRIPIPPHAPVEYLIYNRKEFLAQYSF